MLTDGKYLGRAVSAGATESKNGNFTPWIEFEVMTDSGKETMRWFGSTATEKLSNLAIKSAITAGFRGEDWNDFGNLMMWTPEDVKLTVETEEYQGKSRTRIKWINPATEQMEKFKGQAPKMAGAFTKFRKELGVEKLQEEKQEW